SPRGCWKGVEVVSRNALYEKLWWATSTQNVEHKMNSSDWGSRQCKDGLLVPAMRTSRAATVFYLLALLYCFLGIAIAADVFMCSIEKITSSTRKVRLRRSKKNRLVAEELMAPESECTEVRIWNPTVANLTLMVRLRRSKKNRLVAEELMAPESECTEVRIWNPTVANLTLMALGSSAPEILLSIIEIIGNSFKAGDLGPGTIVGSAAFNLLCITAICVMTIPSPRVTRIQEIAVFAVTSVFSCLAYIWLLVILSLVSPNVVDVWEAAVTLALFAVLVVTAYLADIKVWKRKKANLEVELSADFADHKVAEPEDVDAVLQRFAKEMALESDAKVTSCVVPDFETVRQISRQISRQYPSLSVDDQARLLAYRLKENQVHDRLYYRINATRRMAAAARKTDVEHDAEKILAEAEKAKKAAIITERCVEFSARVYAVQKGIPTVRLTVVRYGPVDKGLIFRYTTVNGVAKRDLHFLSKSETMRFAAGESSKQIVIQLVEGAQWRPNYVFYVHLKLDPQNDLFEKTVLGRTNIARVRMPDYSESFIGEPMVEFVRSNYVVKENMGYVRTYVTRLGRHDARPFSVKYETVGATAQSNVDYEAVIDGTLNFVDDEYEKYIDIRIYDDKKEEKDETFSIDLISTTGDVTIGPKKRTIITIVCDDNVLRNIANVRKLMTYYIDKMTYGTETWFDQIAAATSVNAGDLANATFFDCLMHAISFPWKFLFAFVPPPHFLGGWLCFIISLILIGIVTAIVGDLAGIFGCMVGLKDAITAITFVALGTSLPDTFASKIAAENEPTADNAIGNVTGSNSVNVFLGLGLPWLIAAIYWARKNEPFIVDAGNLGFSVTIFMVTSVCCLSWLMARRYFAFFGKGELGGPFGPKLLTSFFFVFLWFAYVLCSALQAYGYIVV
ncbi:Sodium/calcium exchanger 3, partial [Toxocara canis]